MDKKLEHRNLSCQLVGYYVGDNQPDSLRKRTRATASMLPELRVNSKTAGSIRDITSSTLCDSGQCYNLDTIAKQGVSLAVYTFVYMCMYIMFMYH